ncbi:MAG: glycosyltransferase family 4 protein [Solirubrobacterales bacterium]|nr:glycosyltransferase family 4 protein [Solirubrobacterales bacterium]
MKVGIVSKWTASGQAVVARQIRSALDELGHETFVLARPGSGPRAQQAAEGERDPVWDQPGVTEGSTHEMAVEEYQRWAKENRLEAVLCDENYQWEAIRSLRESGIQTIGRFVWEYFAAEHVAPAREAYDTIYSLTKAEQQRYGKLGIESPYVQWGIHPELLAGKDDHDFPSRSCAPTGETGGAAEDLVGVISFYFPGSFLGRRKPIRKVIRAFGKAKGEHLRLLINAQVPRNDDALREAAAADPRIELMLEDEPEAEHRRRFASCDVCLAPSRWEGLGLPLFEATAFGLPIITNDKPPMSEMVIDDRSGILVPSERNGEARSGIPAWDPDVPAMAAAIERLGDRAELERMSAGVAELREERAWSRTVAGFADLLSG